MADATQNNTLFDPYTQNITLMTADGTSIQTSIADIDANYFECIKIVINYSAQIGASFIMLAAVLLITKPEKRRTPIFIINAFSLICNMIRSTMDTLYYVSPFSETYASIVGDFSRVPRTSYNVSVAAIMFTLFTLIGVETSLVLQVRAVCCNLRRLYYWILMVASAIVALVAISWRLVATVKNAKTILGTENDSLTPFLKAALITEGISIFFFCVIFVGKLGITIWQRRKMGLPKWPPMQYIFIGGACTLVIPAVFAGLEFPSENKTFPEAGSLALTCTAIFLPLSSLWASSAIDRPAPFMETESGGSNPHSANGRAHIPLLRSQANHSVVERGSSRRASPDLEGGLANPGEGGVRVDRSFAIEMLPMARRRS